MNLHASHAWTLRRLLTGHPVNGESQALPEPFRMVAHRLSELPFEARGAIWEGFLTGREDRDGIIMALADADPEGPPPEARTDKDEADGDEWGPIRSASIPPAEPFPVDVLPDPMARLVRDGSESIGCPPDFLAVTALVVAGGAIGRTVSLLLKRGYFASASLFAACVGPPSDGKTPSSKLATDAVRRIDKTLEADYLAVRTRWEDEQAMAEPKGKKSSKSSTPPKPTRIDIDDITMETIPLILAHNPRGLIMISDELTALLLGMNQYKGGKGNDRSTLLKIWSGADLKRDRVSHEANVPIRCPHPCLSIVGGLPPDMLGSMVDPRGRADGFLDRFLFAYPEVMPVPEWSNLGVSEDVADDWCDLVGRLWARPMDIHEGRSSPHVAHFTPEGEAAWIRLHNAHSAEMNAANFPPSWRGPWGKMREYAGRLALILACAEHASDPTADPTAVPQVGPRVVKNAWRLVDY